MWSPAATWPSDLTECHSRRRSDESAQLFAGTTTTRRIYGAFFVIHRLIGRQIAASHVGCSVRWQRKGKCIEQGKKCSHKDGVKRHGQVGETCLMAFHLVITHTVCICTSTYSMHIHIASPVCMLIIVKDSRLLFHHGFLAAEGAPES